VTLQDNRIAGLHVCNSVVKLRLQQIADLTGGATMNASFLSLSLSLSLSHAHTHTHTQL
jgi:hypothetical protein